MTTKIPCSQTFKRINGCAAMGEGEIIRFFPVNRQLTMSEPRLWIKFVYADQRIQAPQYRSNFFRALEVYEKLSGLGYLGDKIVAAKGYFSYTLLS